MNEQPEQNNIDARRQGQFEGQVLASLEHIKTQITQLSSTSNGQTAKIQSLELLSQSVADREKILSSEKIKEHEEIHKLISGLSTTVSGLVEYKSTIRGGLIALGLAGPIVSSVITALIIKWIT